MDSQQFRRNVIREPLMSVALYSQSAENLLFGIAAQESHLGKFVEQVGGGPALGPYQNERGSFEDAVSFLNENANKIFYGKCKKIVEGKSIHDLKTDFKLATIIARLYVMRFPEPLPKPDDIDGMAVYWKKYWNTVNGKGTVEQFVENYKRFS